MAAGDATFRYRITVENADDIKRAFQDIQAAYQTGKISGQQYSEALRDVSRDARVANSEFRNTQQVVLATSPSLRQASEAMSLFGGTARTTLAVINAMNLAQLAMQGQSQSQLDLQLKLVDLERQRAIAVQQGHWDQVVLIDQQINAVRNQQVNVNQQLLLQHVQMGVTFAASSVMIIGESLKIVSGIKAWSMANDGLLNGIRTLIMGQKEATVSTTTYGGALAGIPAEAEAATVSTGGLRGALLGLYTALGPVGLAMIAISVAVPLLIQNWDQITKFFTGTVVPALTVAWQSIINAFTSAWNFLKSGFVAFWNGLVTIANAGIKGITQGISAFVNMWIDAIDSLISAVNTVSPVKFGLIGHVNITAPTIPTIAAATGFEGVVSRPTMFLAGEKGAENVSIRPAGTAGGGGAAGQTVVVINVQGSIWQTRALMQEVDNYFKTQLKRRGYNGLLG